MNCEVCQHPFNLTNRYPILMPCCAETICRECQQQIAGEPQQETFQCPIDYCKEQNSCQANFKINKLVEKQLRESLSIFCDEHPNDLAEFYCKDHHQLVCMGCFSDNHNGHTKKKINKKMLFEYHNIIMEKLEVVYKRIAKLMTTFEAYQKNQISFTANKYLKKVKKAIDILTPQMKTQDEKEMVQFLNQEFKLNQQNQINQIPQQDQSIIPNLDSLILKQEDCQFIKECFGQVNLRLELIYRGTRDTFAASAFHQKCDNQGPTLSIIKSEHNNVFGGYASLSWNNNDGNKADDKAFIISITHKTKHVQYQNYDSAVHHGNYYSIAFGSGNDIYIDDNCNSNQYSHAGIGGTYSLPNGMQYNTDQSNNYLGGSNGFKVIEFEVFKVQIDQLN